MAKFNSVQDRFWVKVDKGGPDECWPWTANTTPSTSGEYGYFKLNGNHKQAHRVAYELSIGPIPYGLELDHLCRNTRCVNPQHLEPVSHKENILRGNSPSAINKRKTHCKRGHSLFGDNLYKVPGGRQCRTCQKQHNKNFSLRRR